MFERDHLHDALLHRICIDLSLHLVEIEMEYYASSDDGKRTPGVLRIEGVGSFSAILGLMSLESHAKFGNFVSWVPSAGGHGYLYFANGCIQVDYERYEIC
jgi:hypothetical protein